MPEPIAILGRRGHLTPLAVDLCVADDLDPVQRRVLQRHTRHCATCAARVLNAWLQSREPLPALLRSPTR